jgi:hypothetical protein
MFRSKPKKTKNGVFSFYDGTNVGANVENSLSHSSEVLLL